MSPASRLCLILLTAPLALGCSASGGSPSLAVGTEGAGGGIGAGGAATFQVDDAGLSKALSAHIERNGMTITFVTLSCSNACADVRAIATGGFAPYQYTWEDGSTDPARHVCPASTMNYRVSVTDTGATSGEFPRPPKTVTAPLEANVIQCLDGGDGTADGGSPTTDGGSPSAPLVYWATWTAPSVGTPGSAQGTLSPPGGDVRVSYAGEVGPASAATGSPTFCFCGTVQFLPASTYTSKTVANGPPESGMITLSGQPTLTQTFTFSAPVQDPLIALIGFRLKWTFDATPTLLSSGSTLVTPLPGYSLTTSGNDVDGNQGAGVVEFVGTFTSISFTVPAAQITGDFTGFTIGIRGRD